ncbi:MAG: hypothetical protein ABI461_07545 [Polyangiaceae bacterium]
MSSSNPVCSAAKRRAHRRSRSVGAAMVEYSFLVIFVAIPTIIGFTAGGLMMHRAYIHARNHLLLPTP